MAGEESARILLEIQHLHMFCSGRAPRIRAPRVASNPNGMRCEKNHQVLRVTAGQDGCTGNVRIVRRSPRGALRFGCTCRYGGMGASAPVILSEKRLQIILDYSLVDDKDGNVPLLQLHGHTVHPLNCFLVDIIAVVRCHGTGSNELVCVPGY
jgi:hypothetical protein